MKVAIVHYWLVGMRGGERVLEKLLELYPNATIITHVYDPESVSAQIRSAEIRQTFISKLPKAQKNYEKYLPLMPLALEQMDMQEFDLIISSESGPAKGIVPRPDATHVCYCHSPMRYIWDHYHIYRSSAGMLTRYAMPLIAHKLRIWDVIAAARVDRFIANSRFVASRIEKYYRRKALVIPPPVSVEEFSVGENVGDHYLLAGELVPYKRPDLAINAFTVSGRKLTVIGDGEMRASLESRAGPSIDFLGRIPFDQLKREFAECRALIFPGEEDFGIVPVEVMASGRPVVALGRGGALDSIKEGETGLFFSEPTTESLNAAIMKLEDCIKTVGNPEQIRRHAMTFDGEIFKRRISEAIEYTLQDKTNGALN